ncbi:hypothetical protein M9H77_19278 [Catharanthus roseus]|uniref:Uncharacterized protein n=1 Tax=Catharanthus roseus TaxID=4058 RepID=A0ACC0B9U0_CATRO|nr:hypothetical protein M9H77_19278 [Catharanthus roseus]
MREFIKIFSQLKLNLPLCDFLLQVPKYVRQLRDMIMKKDKLCEASAHTLGEECSAFLTKKLSFSFPCTIGSLHVDMALVDLGANINIISSTLFEQLVLDMDDEVDFPIILGRPFLRTSRALIDMEKGKPVLRVGGNEIVFKFPLFPSPLSKVQDTRRKDDEKRRQLSSKVKARFMKNFSKWRMNDKD